MFLRVNKNFLPVKFWKSISWQKVSFWISAQSIMAVLTLFFVLIRVTTGKDSMKFHKWAPARRLFTHFFSKIGIYPLDIQKYFDYNDFKILWPRNAHADSLRVKIKKNRREVSGDVIASRIFYSYQSEQQTYFLTQSPQIWHVL